MNCIWRGVPRPTCVNKSIAFCTMSRFASRSGKMLMAASVMKRVSAWFGTSMMKTWLIRRAVRSGQLRAARLRGELRFLERWIDKWLINQVMPEDREIAVAVDAAPSSRGAIASGS